MARDDGVTGPATRSVGSSAADGRRRTDVRTGALRLLGDGRRMGPANGSRRRAPASFSFSVVEVEGHQRLVAAPRRRAGRAQHGGERHPRVGMVGERVGAPRASRRPALRQLLRRRVLTAPREHLRACAAPADRRLEVLPAELLARAGVHLVGLVVAPWTSSARASRAAARSRGTDTERSEAVVRGTQRRLRRGGRTVDQLHHPRVQLGLERLVAEAELLERGAAAVEHRRATCRTRPRIASSTAWQLSAAASR